jgi:hypothetical protein
LVRDLRLRSSDYVIVLSTRQVTGSCQFVASGIELLLEAVSTGPALPSLRRRLAAQAKELVDDAARKRIADAEGRACPYVRPLPVGKWTPQLLALLRRCQAAMDRGRIPVLTRDGEGGTYFLPGEGDTEATSYIAALKPRDEEAFAPNNPKTHRGKIGQITHRDGVLSGEAWQREVSAYLVDREGFIGVPATCAVEVSHPALCNGVMVDPSLPRLSDLLQGGTVVGGREECPTLPHHKIGSLQQFVPFEHMAADYSMTVLPTREVQKIAAFDLWMLNSDRNGENILLVKAAPPLSPPPHAANEEPWFVVPIDHGLALPHSLDIGWSSFEWTSDALKRQMSAPLDPSVKRWILSRDPDREASILRSELGIREHCLLNFRLAGRVLQKCIKAGLTLSDVCGIFCRHDAAMEAPSTLERLAESARSISFLLLSQAPTKTLPATHRSLAGHSMSFYAGDLSSAPKAHTIQQRSTLGQVQTALGLMVDSPATTSVSGGEDDSFHEASARASPTDLMSDVPPPLPLPPLSRGVSAPVSSRWAGPEFEVLTIVPEGADLQASPTDTLHRRSSSDGSSLSVSPKMSPSELNQLPLMERRASPSELNQLPLMERRISSNPGESPIGDTFLPSPPVQETAQVNGFDAGAAILQTPSEFEGMGLAGLEQAGHFPTAGVAFPTATSATVEQVEKQRPRPGFRGVPSRPPPTLARNASMGVPGLARQASYSAALFGHHASLDVRSFEADGGIVHALAMSAVQNATKAVGTVPGRVRSHVGCAAVSLQSILDMTNELHEHGVVIVLGSAISRDPSLLSKGEGAGSPLRKYSGHRMQDDGSGGTPEAPLARRSLSTLCLEDTPERVPCSPSHTDKTEDGPSLAIKTSTALARGHSKASAGSGADAGETDPGVVTGMAGAIVWDGTLTVAAITPVGKDVVFEGDSKVGSAMREVVANLLITAASGLERRDMEEAKELLPTASKAVAAAAQARKDLLLRSICSAPLRKLFEEALYSSRIAARLHSVQSYQVSLSRSETGLSAEAQPNDDDDDGDDGDDDAVEVHDEATDEPVRRRPVTRRPSTQRKHSEEDCEPMTRMQNLTRNKHRLLPADPSKRNPSSSPVLRPLAPSQSVQPPPMQPSDVHGAPPMSPDVRPVAVRGRSRSASRSPAVGPQHSPGSTQTKQSGQGTSMPHLDLANTRSPPLGAQLEPVREATDGSDPPITNFGGAPTEFLEQAALRGSAPLDSGTVETRSIVSNVAKLHPFSAIPIATAISSMGPSFNVSRSSSPGTTNFLKLFESVGEKVGVGLASFREGDLPSTADAPTKTELPPIQTEARDTTSQVGPLALTPTDGPIRPRSVSSGVSSSHGPPRDTLASILDASLEQAFADHPQFHSSRLAIPSSGPTTPQSKDALRRPARQGRSFTVMGVSRPRPFPIARINTSIDRSKSLVAEDDSLPGSARGSEGGGDSTGTPSPAIQRALNRSIWPDIKPPLHELSQAHGGSVDADNESQHSATTTTGVFQVAITVLGPMEVVPDRRDWDPEGLSLIEQSEAQRRATRLGNRVGLTALREAGAEVSMSRTADVLGSPASFDVERLFPQGGDSRPPEKKNKLWRVQGNLGFASSNNSETDSDDAVLEVAAATVTQTHSKPPPTPPTSTAPPGEIHSASPAKRRSLATDTGLQRTASYSNGLLHASSSKEQSARSKESETYASVAAASPLVAAAVGLPVTDMSPLSQAKLSLVGKFSPVGARPLTGTAPTTAVSVWDEWAGDETKALLFLQVVEKQVDFVVETVLNSKRKMPRNKSM